MKKKTEISELNNDSLLWVVNNANKYDIASIREVVDELNKRGIEYKKIDSYSIRLTNAEKATPAFLLRFIEYVIDSIIITAIYFVLYSLLLRIDSYILFYYLMEISAFGIPFCYYFLLESFWGRTFGKLLSGLKVVDIDGNKPSIGSIAIRSLCRLIPIEPFSFFYNQWVVGPRMAGHWHDNLSKTYVVSIKKLSK